MCNFRKLDLYPLNDKCFINDMIYMATAQFESLQEQYYIGSRIPFKQRYYYHMMSIEMYKYKNRTAFSKYIYGT